MTSKIAQILSVVLHPLLMSTYIFLTLFYVAPETIQNLETLNSSAGVHFGERVYISIKDGLLMLIFMYTFLIPVLVIYYFYKFGWIQNLELKTLQDRRLPYLASVIIYTFATVFFALKIRQLPEIALILGSITFSIGVVAVISLYWQISAHAVGISGMLGALGGLILKFGPIPLFEPFLLALLLSGYLCAARLQLNAHTPVQIVAGFVLGLLVSLTTVVLWV